MLATDSTVFREYDIRGIANEQITPAFAEQLGQAFVTYLRQHGPGGRRVVVGRDGRASSPALQEAVLAGLRTAGAETVDVGMVSTPILYYSRVLYDAAGGVMVTASHNPPEFNGFKLAMGPGTLHGDAIQAVGRLMAGAGALDRGDGSHRVEDPLPAYLGLLQKKIRLDRPLTVAVDAGNGVAGPAAVEALQRWGCRVLPLYCDVDPTFPNHHPDPTKAANLVDLQQLVARERVDVALGFDGDGDRLGVLDEQGRLIWADRYMVLFWREILSRHPGAPAPVEVKCSQVLWEEIERAGGKPFFCRTGHSLVKAVMRETGAPFAGEMSGHLFFADEYFGFDDALYAAGRLLRLLAAREQPLSALLDTVPVRPATPEVRVDCPDDRKFAVVRELLDHFRRRYPVVDVDGVRVLFPAGWGLVRASNTQPVLVLRAEARTNAALDQICGEIAAALKTVAGLAPVDWAG